MEKDIKAHSKELLEALKKVSLFKDFADNEEAMRKIADLCKVKNFPIGSTIIKEGERGEELYIIHKGDADVIKKTLQNEEYTVVTLKGEWGGIFFGHLALLDEEKRSATVMTKTNCTLIIITRNDFMKFGEENPGLGLRITRVLAKQLSADLRKANQDVITLFSALVDEISEEGIY